MTAYRSTDEFMAVKLPHLRKSWLTRINEKLGRLKSDPKNGGNVEMCTRFKNGRDQWNDWRERDLSAD